MNSTNETYVAEITPLALIVIHRGAFVIIAALSLLGNGLTIVAIKKFPSLQTPTNYLILSLAVSDFLQPVGIGLSMTMDVFAASVCSKYYGVASTIIMIVPFISSFLHLLMIAAERFVAVMRPLRYHSLITFRVVRNMLVAAWILASAIGLSMFVVSSITYKVSCGFYDETQITVATYQMSVNFAIYFLVAASLIVLYSKIAVVARGHRRRVQSMPQTGGPLEGRKTEKYSNLMTYILILFILTWTPLIVISFLSYAGFGGLLFQAFSTVFQQVAISNCCINAFLYAWRSKPLYGAYKKLLCRSMNC